MQNLQNSYESIQTKLSAGVKRQLNEHYFHQGLISQQMYEVAKNILQKDELERGESK